MPGERMMPGQRSGESLLYDGKVFVLEHAIIEDERGVLSPIELVSLGFDLARVFVVAARDGAVRGAHGHRQGRQILIQVRGEIEIDLLYRGRPERLTLTPRQRAVLMIPASRAICLDMPDSGVAMNVVNRAKFRHMIEECPLQPRLSWTNWRAPSRPRVLPRSIHS
jgi:hypothetical protein